jgi:uncharacterized phage protein gp47/JayE
MSTTASLPPTVTIPGNGLEITLPAFPTVAQILLSLQAAVEALNSLLTNFNGGGVTETYLEGACLALGSDASTYPGVTAEGAYQLLTDVQNAAFVLTAKGTALDLKAADLGVSRKLAVAAQGGYVFTNLAGPVTVDTIIAKGAIVASNPADPTQSPVLYTSTAPTTIPAGSAQSGVVNIAAANPGSAGNAIPGAVKTVVAGAPGCSGVNPTAIAGGADTEGDDAPSGGLRARTLNAIADASQCTISAIENDAASFPGVTSAVLAENTADDGITPLLGRGQLYIDDGSGNLGADANSPIVATVQAAFTSGLYRAAGTQVHVVGSVLLLATVTLAIRVSQQYVLTTATAASVAAAVQLAIYTYFAGLTIGKPAYVSEIIRYAAEVPGVVDVIIGGVTINGMAGNLQPSPSQVLRCADLASIGVATVVIPV